MDKLWRRCATLVATNKRNSSDAVEELREQQGTESQVNNGEIDNQQLQQHPLARRQSGLKSQETSQTKSVSKRTDAFESYLGDNVAGDDDGQDELRDQEKQNGNKQNDATELTQRSAAQPSPAGFYDCLTPLTRSRLNTLAQIGEDWLYLALLGIIMALLSLFMDSMITMFLGTRIWLSEEMSEHNLPMEYLAWCLVPILLVTFSTGFVHLCSPTAIGSGIPEMKTILRGVVLNEYLTFRTLIAKIVGLTFTLGSGLPLGKEGPSVHMASIVATLLSKLVASFQGIYENESRTSEMLSAACAVGVAATFYAPIGGVLFSIEVTTAYFAIRNYWRGFFAACCGATIWRLLGFYIQNDESISAIFKTNFSTDYPFDPVELLLFSFIGATCGLGGAAYIKFHREIVQFFRRHKRISDFFQRNRFVYPTLVTLIITTSTFPPLLGQYTAATLSTHTTIEHLFSNRTWSLGSQDLVSKRILDSWTTESTGFHVHLILYIVMLFWTSALASTIPTPSGVFIPVVKMGAAYGRLIGELMAAAYPTGIKYSHPATIVPGSYAVVGAAAFSGAVTHTVSTSVILFEMTGQIVHIIPVILGVLIANAVCQSLQPSIYDSIIEIKKLPYLPPIASSNSISHRILVKDFMNTKNIPFIWKERCTYADLKALLSTHRKIISFPLVESPETMKLLGSVARPDLLKLLYIHLGRERRLQEVCRRNSDTLTPAIHLLNSINGRPLSESSPPSATNNQASDNSGGKSAWQKRSQTDQMAAVGQKCKNVGVDSSISDDKDLEFRPMTLFATGNDRKATAKAHEPEKEEHEQQPSRVLQLQRTIAPPSPNMERQNSSISDSVMVVNGGQTNCSSSATMSIDDDCDPTRLIISASKNCHKYGATVSTREQGGSDKQRAPMGPIGGGTTTPALESGIKQEAALSISNLNPTDTKKPRLGEERLLSECQKREDAYDEARKEFKSVAKFINHYDRGSSMDEEHLERSIQEVEGHLAKVQKIPPEIVVIVDSLPGDGGGNHTRHEPCNQLVATMRSREYEGRHQIHQNSKELNWGPSILQPPLETPSQLQTRASYHHKPESASSLAAAPPPSKQCQQQKQTPEQTRPAAASEQRHSSAPSPNLYHHYSQHRKLLQSVPSSPSLSSRPTKSILKTSSCSNVAKRSMNNSPSFVFSNSMNISPGQQQQQQHLVNINLMQNVTNHSRDDNSTTNGLATGKSFETTTNHLSNLKFTLAPEQLERGLSYDLEAGGLQKQQDQQQQQQQNIRQRRKVRLPRLRVIDMTPEEQEQWEKEQLSAYIDLNKCQIDEAPFQLVEQTSLYRVHTLFSMLGLNHAYVTSFGRLVGIVALKDIRYAIEKMLQEKV